MALEGALQLPAREPALPELRGGQVRPASPHALRQASRTHGVGRERAPLAPLACRRRHPHRSLRDHQSRSAVGTDPALLPRHGLLRRPVVSYVLLAQRARGTGREARRRHRHRGYRHPGDRRDRRQGRRAQGVPAPPQLEHPAEQLPRLRNRDGRDPRSLRRDLRQLRCLAPRLRACASLGILGHDRCRAPRAVG